MGGGVGRRSFAEADDGQDAPPFVAAYAEALGLPVGTHERDSYHSVVLQAWGVDLYNAVAEDLRPMVLQLAQAAACARGKRDVWWRLADRLGRVELADWYTSTSFTYRRPDPLRP